MGISPANGQLPNAVVTFLPTYGDECLIIQRSSTEGNFPGLWAFPGGKVEIGETAIDAVVRELAEETSLTPAGSVCFLDSYWFGTSVGFAFGITVLDQDVTAEQDGRWTWIRTQGDLSVLPRIAGIDNHYARLQEVMRTSSQWVSLRAANLTPESYLNL
jgi:mutator protein MutT